MSPFIARFLSWFVRGLAGAFFAPGLVIAQQTFDPNNPPTSATPPTEQYNHYTGTFSHQKGPKTVLVILVQPSDGAAWTNPPAFSTLDSQLNSASQNYYNSSYRQTWFGPKRQSGLDIERLVVTPVLVLPKTAANYLESFGTLQADSLAAVRAQGGAWNGGNRDPNYFDRQVVMSNTKMISSTGLAYVGGRFSWVGTSLSGTVTEHEWGHNWGVIHANGWNVPSGQHPRSSSGSSAEYKDDWDVMGGGSPTQGFNTQFRENLGFLERSRGEALDVTASGVYRLYDYIHPHRRQDAGSVRALVLPMGSFTDPKRVILGFGHLPGTDGGTSRTDWNRNAVTVHSKLSNGSDRIDTTPFSRQTDDANDSSIKIGRTYSEGANVNGTQIYGGFHVTPLARGNTVFNGVPHEWIDVAVNYQNAIGANQSPTAFFAQTLYSDAVPGIAYNLQVQASDPDGDTLAYDWDFGDGTYSITNASAQNKTWATAGFYLVTCTISDMKGGVTVARAWVNVGAAPFRAPENPAATGAGIAYRYYEGVFNNLPNFVNLLPVKTGEVATFTLSPRSRADNFAFLFEGFVTVPTSDVYTFFLRSDDGSRLYIGDVLLVDNDGLKSNAIEESGNIALSAGVHRIRVEFFHRDGAESLSVEWSTLSSAKAPIPEAALGQTDWGANTAPTVAITAPADGDSVIVGSAVEIQVDAADTDGVARVAFFAGGSYLGEDTTAPFSLVWPDVAAGDYQLTAVAYDATGRFTISATNTLQVSSPPARDSIGINFVDKGGASATLAFNQVAGAFFTQPHWNNAPQGTYSATDWNATVTGLVDQAGGTTSAWTRYLSRANGNHGDAISNADTSTANGRLMRGGLMVRNDSRSPEVEVHDIPYLEYDVYVYFDVLETNAGDRTAAEYVLTPQGQSPMPSIWGRNSRVAGDGIGDYPSYDTWVGFKEATATASNSPEAQQLGNYVVFRGVKTESFHLVAKRVSSVSINAVQIVSQDPKTPRVALLQTGGATAVTEGGETDSYAVILAYPPTSNVTITVSPDSQLQVDRTTLVFTPQTWNQPQAVVVRAVDDALVEGPHAGSVNHTVSAAGNYVGLSAPTLSVAIADNDQAIVSVVARGSLVEGNAGTASLLFTREGQRSIASALSVSFQMSGTAALAGDYTFSGASVSYDSGSGAGTITIPAGQSEALLTVSAANNSTAEYGEAAVLTILASGSAAVGTPSSASIFIRDDDVTDYLVECFNNSTYGGRVWDLSNRSITFTPSGSTYTAETNVITAFPSGTAGFTSFDKAAMTAGNSASGWWTHTLSVNFTFHGTSYSRIFISTEGVITFGSGVTVTGFISNLFGTSVPKIAAFWTDLNPGAAGNVQHRRVNDGTESRTVIYYNAVRINNGNTNNASFQIELFDDGRIRFAYLPITIASGTVVVGLATGVTNTMPSSNYTESASPRPFYQSDFTLYPATAPANTAPRIVTTPLLTATAGQAYGQIFAAADPDVAQALAFTTPTKPAWLTLTDHGNRTATLAGTPPAAGTYPVTLQVSDGTLTAELAYSIMVVPSGGNTPPVFTSTPPTTALVGSTYSHAVAVTDADGHAISLSMLQHPAWLTLTDNGDGSGLLTGLVPSGASATNIVSLSAGDGLSSVVQRFEITVNRAPSITLARPLGGVVQTPSLDQDLHLVAEVDPRGGSLALDWTRLSGPGGVLFSDASAADTRVRFDTAGLHVFQLAADNGFGVATAKVYVFANTPADDVITNQLQGYWRFNEQTGPTFSDSSGSDRAASSATAAAQPTVGALGHDGAALGLTGVQNQFARVEYAQPNVFTVSAWIRAEDIPSSGNRTVFSFVNDTTARARLQLPSGGSRLRFFSNYNTAGEWRIEYDIPAQEWVHVTLSYDRGNVSNNPVAYIDGRPVAVTRLVAPSGTNQPTNHLRIGCTTGSNTWMGVIDELRLYDRAVSAADVPLLMTAGAINIAPRVTPGGDIDAAPGQTVSLAGAVEDDGLPLVPGQPDTLWTQVSGPVSGTFLASSTPVADYVVGTANGGYVLRLTADDGAARSSATLTVGVTGAVTEPPALPATFGAWQQSEFGDETDPLIIGSGADPDVDGIPNFLEYALAGGDPLTPNAVSISPVSGTLETGGQRYLTLTYTRRAGVTDLTYAVEASGSLGAGSWIDAEVVLVDENGDTVTVRDGTALSAEHPRRFLRLRITR